MDIRHPRESEPGEPTHIHIPRPSRVMGASLSTSVAREARDLCGDMAIVALLCGDAADAA
jgi:hypothetical protein